MASRARCSAFAESRPATSAVARKLNSATQFSGSQMVSVPNGGRKKKLKTNAELMDATNASTNPHVLAIVNTSRK